MAGSTGGTTLKESLTLDDILSCLGVSQSSLELGSKHVLKSSGGDGHSER
jgi:hypothetical protein